LKEKQSLLKTKNALKPLKKDIKKGRERELGHVRWMSTRGKTCRSWPVLLWDCSRYL